MQKRILSLVEKEGREIAPVTFELLQAGRKLADKGGESLCAVVLGHEVSDISKEIASFSDEVYCLDNTLLATFQVDIYVAVLANLCLNLGPNTVLMGHTLDNLDLAPRLAYRMETQLVTDCIDVDIDLETGHLLCTKPVYGGNAIAIFEIDKKPQMVTLRPKVMEAIQRRATTGEIINFESSIDATLAKTESIEIITGETVSLDRANAIVTGGRGAASIEGIKELEGLAAALKRYFDKVELGATRPVIDANLLPSYHQIGLTGEKVNPELYIAVGVSGASQHIAGITGTKKIVAINKNPQAPIFNIADYGVVGQYQDVLPAFIKKLEEFS